MRHITYIIAIAILATLTACGSMLAPIKTPEVKQYTLNTPSSKTLTSRSTNKSILIPRPIANPGYETDKMIYSTTRHQLRSFAENRWTAPPADMLQSLIVQSLMNSRYFHAVAPTPSTGDTDFRLDTRLLRLKQEFTQGQPSRIKMAIFAELVNTETNKIIATKRFAATVIAPENNPYSGVIAANQATRQLLTQLTSFTARSIRCNCQPKT